ncbi:hypothetical protein [Paenibacillus glycanilyticus]|uniref:Lipoprotein n=1 Tax=Paenibacillus glycanilyticus TaxID=126569 RepID=A0ABQ6GN16_9BACL|nr:hypothetical protein [Paenibacillus glycanilyticus]GLX71031.1 hypothetical protein MU1_53790 [Paenibacillus glycanilyticus]
MSPFMKVILSFCTVIVMTSCTESIILTKSNQIQPDKLVVKRVDPLHQSNEHFEKKLDDKEAVEKLYHKIVYLPSFPQGAISCPMDNGVQYELDFMVDSKLVAKALVSATGCQAVTMHEKTLWSMEPKGNGFRALLKQDIGLDDKEMLS